MARRFRDCLGGCLGLFLWMAYTLGANSASPAPCNNRGRVSKKPPVVRSQPQRVLPRIALNKKKPSKKPSCRIKPIVVAIDAGHGGRDPGAIGPTGLREKQVTLAIAYRLASLLQQDQHFSPVLIRTHDQFIPVGERSLLARQRQAQLLISIHADGAANRQARGASVWVLSNQRAHREVGRWLTEPRPQLLGGTAPLLAQPRDNHLHHALLDLQFGHSQQVGSQVASAVLQELAKVVPLHKSEPEYASLGVLQSLDIPSLLVESGFITHRDEERLLKQPHHQRQLANAIYRGIKQYFQTVLPLPDPLQSSPHLVKASAVSSPTTRTSPPQAIPQSRLHVVQRGESLWSIAVRYQCSWRTLQHHNQLNTHQLRVGQKIEIPASTQLVKKLH